MESKEERVVHTVKCDPDFFDDVRTGRKPFEVRKDDRNYQKGDMLCLVEFDRIKARFTGRVILRKITYVLNATQYADGLQPGYSVLGLDAFMRVSTGWNRRQIEGDLDDELITATD